MLKDQVVKLQPKFALAAATAGTAATKVVVSLSAEAPSGRCRLRLWDSYGRNPSGPNPVPFVDRLQQKETLPAPQDGLQGCTLTWTLRLQPNARGQTYKVRVAILQVEDEREEARGEFTYAGPLDDFQEIAGRIHFDVGE